MKDMTMNDEYKRSGRNKDELRPVKITKDFAPAAAGSVLIEMGNTRVICAASIDNHVPRWMRLQKVPGGWLTAEYSMLPYATDDRSRREGSSGKISGRTQEIQRLIGRSLRAVTDLKLLGERSIWIDCDVLQADGGTRTAAITGSYVALRLALNSLLRDGIIERDPLREPLAAVSVGIIDGKALLDLNYEEDFAADVDMNVVMTGSGKFVEVQGTAEEAPYTRDQLNELLDLAQKGIEELFEVQSKV